MLTEYKWSKTSLNCVQGGKMLFDWLEDSRDLGKPILFVCGAGISMTGSSPAPSGWKVGDAYESYLRSKGVEIPEDISGNIARLYEHFCYENDAEDNRVFSYKKHNEFIEAITNRNNEFYFSGKPNFQHRSLVNEVLEANGNIRIYSLNLDEFFDVAGVISHKLPRDSIVNAGDLLDKHRSNPIFQNWRILAAHGKNIKNTRSVWSENILANDLDTNTPAYLDGEKEILLKAVECISEGPYYDKVIFVGLAAPLNYLMKTLAAKLSPSIQWTWINPFEEPKDWLIRDGKGAFNEENGDWIKSSLTDCLWQAQAIFYERWLSSSCSLNISEIALLQKYSQESYKKVLVESLYRARRIYDNGVRSLIDCRSNPDLLSYYNDCNEVYSYPQKISGNKYSDIFLGEALHKLFQSEVKLDRGFGTKFPRLTIAGRSSENAPVSAHIFKFEKIVPDNEVAYGIAKTFDEVFIDPNHRHIVIIDVKNYEISSLARAISEEIAHRFPNDYKYIDVITSNDLDTYLNDNNFSNPPVRGKRP
jgi:hypothetical protein